MMVNINPQKLRDTLPHHCPGTSRYARIIFMIKHNRHCVVTGNGIKHCIIKSSVVQIISRSQNEEGRDLQGM